MKFGIYEVDTNNPDAGGELLGTRSTDEAAADYARELFYNHYSKMTDPERYDLRISPVGAEHHEYSEECAA
jgi:hypothetical protein